MRRNRLVLYGCIIFAVLVIAVWYFSVRWDSANRAEFPDMVGAEVLAPKDPPGPKVCRPRPPENSGGSKESTSETEPTENGGEKEAPASR